MKHYLNYTRFVRGIVLALVLWGVPERGDAQIPVANGEIATAQEITIDMESYMFTPSEVTVANGKSLRLILRNQSFLVPHNFLLDDPDGIRILEADISSGETQAHTVTLTKPGIYLFYCDKQLLFFPTHREEGMEGRLIVQ